MLGLDRVGGGAVVPVDTVQHRERNTPKQPAETLGADDNYKSCSKMPDSLKDGCEARWAWSRRDKSHEVRLYGKKMQTAHFHPNWSNGTAGVRGTKPLNYGRHYWEIKISQRIFGTSMMFGIGTKHARLHVDAFVNMLGEDEHSWGLSHKGLLWHNGKWRRYCSPFQENESTIVGMLFDWSTGTLTYFKDGECLGVAFTELKKISDGLYPIVCSTAAKTEMTLGLKWRSFSNLQDRCRATILTNLAEENSIERLPLPNPMREFLRESG
ncbi:SPRY domain-containing SOCS box protein 3-like [Haliotis cracherodii]|uniref:SPRY domain-containing SOCS box protein 3-like n=1 Tax=Haliotis rufescens TaxID=6454 RepID=UPI001EAFD8DB|nr:SPRY domain-containing SOCS box protein 3-like [Haliotis rufescens]